MKIQIQVFWQVFLAFGLSSLILVAILILSKKALATQSFSSPFECGFQPMHNSRAPFSLQFFLLALVFLIFDVEVVLFFPLQLTILSVYSSFFLTFCLFWIFLLAGLLVEWSQASLEWMK